MKNFKRLDKFGEKFSFNYNGYDKYSTRIGGLVCLIICIISLTNFILNVIPFIQKKNYTLQFYSVNSITTEHIILKSHSIIFGIDCGEEEKTKKAYEEYFNLSVSFTFKNDSEVDPNYNNTIKSKQCNRSDFAFDDELYNRIKELKINDLPIEKFSCLENNKHEIQGIYTDKIFAYYKITVLAKGRKNNSEINDFLFQNDCKLQFYYIDYSINVTNYTNPFKPLINSLFLELNPDFLTRKNVFFMNYHFKTDDRLFHLYDSEKAENEEKTNIGYSRVEDYFLYKGVNTSSNFEDNDKYANLYIRADNKRMEIKRENQNVLDFYAENSAFWGSLFTLLNFFFTIYNNFHANRSMSRKLFFLEEKENNKFNFLKRRNSITSNASLIVNSININDITMNTNEEKEDKNNNANTMPVIFTPQNYNNFIRPSDKKINSEERNMNKKDEKENKKKNSFTILSHIISYFKNIFCCCKNKLNFEEKLINNAADIFDKKLDIYIYIKNMILIDIMYKVLMDDINKDCINFISRSLIYLDKKKKEEEEELNTFYKPTSKCDSKYSDKLFSEFKSLIDKKEKTEIEKKIIALYTDH